MHAHSSFTCAHTLLYGHTFAYVHVHAVQADQQPLRLILSFEDARANVIDMLPAQLRPFANNLMLETSGLQLLTLSNEAILQEVRAQLEQRPGENMSQARHTAFDRMQQLMWFLLVHAFTAHVGCAWPGEPGLALMGSLTAVACAMPLQI